MCISLIAAHEGNVRPSLDLNLIINNHGRNHPDTILPCQMSRIRNVVDQEQTASTFSRFNLINNALTERTPRREHLYPMGQRYLPCSSRQQSTRRTVFRSLSYRTIIELPVLFSTETPPISAAFPGGTRTSFILVNPSQSYAGFSALAAWAALVVGNPENGPSFFPELWGWSLFAWHLARVSVSVRYEIQIVSIIEACLRHLY